MAKVSGWVIQNGSGGRRRGSAGRQVKGIAINLGESWGSSRKTEDGVGVAGGSS
jgi:hypothetical protein